MRTRTALTLAALTVAVAAPTAGAVTKSVRLESKTFAPATITIHAGDGIRFRWISGYHNIRRVSGPTFAKVRARSTRQRPPHVPDGRPVPPGLHDPP